MKLVRLLSITFVGSVYIFVMARAQAFSLLGPYTDWMQSSNGFRLPFNYYGWPGNIGGPMSISNGYRWNVPVVTYGFDASFLNFFGSNGISAVEGAVNTLNALPPASEIFASNYPAYTTLNSAAQAASLWDLQSVTLSLLLEQLGLAQPTLSIYVLKGWSSGVMQNRSDSWTVDDWVGLDVLSRNYDPDTLAASESVNGFSYWGAVFDGFDDALDPVNFAFIAPFQEDLTDPSTAVFSAVADRMLDTGQIYSGLTGDDAAGLSYLYSSNNVRYETLLSNVFGALGNTDPLVNGAWRPGVESVKFVSQPIDSASGRFLPLTNAYFDTYVTNGVVTQQQVQRVTVQPDILFSAGDIDDDYPAILSYDRTGTSNWLNNAALNGTCSGAGPGVIQPPIRITFGTIGEFVYVFDDITNSGPFFDLSNYWASFDATTNAPIVYPQGTLAASNLVVRIWFPYGPPPALPIEHGQSVQLYGGFQPGKAFVLQASTNLIDWIAIQTNINNGTVWTVLDWHQATSRFYRVIPQ